MKGDLYRSLDHLGQVDFDMVSRPFKMEVKVKKQYCYDMFHHLYTCAESC